MYLIPLDLKKLKQSDFEKNETKFADKAKTFNGLLYKSHYQMEFYTSILLLSCTISVEVGAKLHIQRQIRFLHQ